MSLVCPYHVKVCPYHVKVCPCHVKICPYHVKICPNYVLRCPYYVLTVNTQAHQPHKPRRPFTQHTSSANLQAQPAPAHTERVTPKRPPSASPRTPTQSPQQLPLSFPPLLEESPRDPSGGRPQDRDQKQVRVQRGRDIDWPTPPMRALSPPPFPPPPLLHAHTPHPQCLRLCLRAGAKMRQQSLNIKTSCRQETHILIPALQTQTLIPTLQTLDAKSQTLIMKHLRGLGLQGGHRSTARRRARGWQ